MSGINWILEMNKQTALSDTRIKNTKPSDKPIKLIDGGGLFLLINPCGSRLWRYRYSINGKENVFALGTYGVAPAGELPKEKLLRVSARILTLAEARNALIEARIQVKAGIHPARARAETKRLAAISQETTFEGVAREWLGRVGVKWKPETLRQRVRMLEADVFPILGKRPIIELTRLDLNNLIIIIEGRAPQMAILARQVLQAIFDHAEITGVVNESIALRLMKVEKPKVNHARQLSQEEIGKFLRDCDDYKGTFEIRAAMKLAWLTLGRTMEVLCAEWKEFDLEQKIWRIPASRMKMARDHLIPLSNQATELLQCLILVTGNGKYLFPNRNDRKRPVSKGALWKMVLAIGWRDRFSPHGLRGTACTIMNESGHWFADVIERLLAHTEENQTRASYNAAQYLAQRKEALQWWADFLDTKWKA